jgi:hypothetical protein
MEEEDPPGAGGEGGWRAPRLSSADQLAGVQMPPGSTDADTDGGGGGGAGRGSGGGGGGGAMRGGQGATPEQC